MDRRVSLLFLAVLVLLAGCSGLVSDPSIDERRVEQLVLEEVNEIRTDHGMSALSYNERAAEKARSHARDMAKNQYFDHTSLQGETQIERYRFCQGGENAAKTHVHEDVIQGDGDVVRYTTSEELASGIVQQWMNSRPHRVKGIYGEQWISAGPGVAINEDNEVYAVLGFCST